MSPDATPPAKSPPHASPAAPAPGDAERQGDLDGGVAPAVGAPPEPPPGAGPVAPADSGEPPDEPPRRRRRWAVLRVLLATLALGWWTQRAMRRHFDSGPYTGPLYLFESVAGTGLMDDTGHVVIAAGEWETLEPLVGPDGMLWLARRNVRTPVVTFDGKLPVRESLESCALYDGSGRRVWENGPPRVMLKSRFYLSRADRVREIPAHGMLRVIPRDQKARAAKQSLITLDGKVILEADEIELDEGFTHSPIALVRDRLPGAASEEWGLVRALLWRDGRWMEVATHPSLRFYKDGTMPWQRGTDVLSELAGFEVLARGKPYECGVLRGDLRWMLPTPMSTEPLGGVIANAPGSQPGDPPVFTLTERVDGAWLAVGRTDKRVVLAGGLWGLQAADGRWVVEPRWSAVFKYSRDGLLGIEADGRQSIVDLAGRVRLAPVAATVGGRELPGDANESVAFPVYVPFPFPDAAAAAPGAGTTAAAAPTQLRVAYEEDDDDDDSERCGFLNAQGDWVVPPIYSALDEEWERDGVSAYVGTAADTGLLALFRADGTQVLPPRCKTLGYLGEGRWYVEELDDAQLAAGTKKLDIQHVQYMTSWSEWCAWSPGGRIVNIDDDQAPPVDLQCELFWPTEDTDYLVVRNGKVGLVDRRGQDILPAIHTRLLAPYGMQALLARDEPDGTHSPAEPLTAGMDVYADLQGHVPIADDGEHPQYRVFDRRTRRWLPQTLACYEQGSAIRSRKDGWGLLQPDLQTLLDYHALGLPGLLDYVQLFDQRQRIWYPVGVPREMPQYFAMVGGKVGLFLPDGRIVIPFVNDRFLSIDARFLRLKVGKNTYLLDRAGRLIVPGGETTWAALGAPGFVPLQRAVPAAADGGPPK